MKQTADVVVIGAGIQGLSAAYHLAKKGISDVVVVEKAFIGAGSSGRSASMLMLQMWTEWQIRFSVYCYERFMHFEEEFGVSPDFHRTGTLSLATSAVTEQERALADLRMKYGIETEMMDPIEVNRRWPLIDPEGLAFGVFGPADGGIEAQSIMLGFKDGAKRLGAEVYQGIQAIDIRIEGGRVAGVMTNHGEIACRWVVNAAGMDAGEVGKWVGLDIPVDNRVRNIFVTDGFRGVPDSLPFVWDAEGEWYIRKEGPGLLVGKGKRKAIEPQMGVDWAYLPEVFEEVVERVPVLAEAGIASGWSGVRPLSPDERPVLGPVAGLEGYINDCCWGGEGIMHSPIGGQLVAEWIHDGRPSTFEGEPFLLSRFGG